MTVTSVFTGRYSHVAIQAIFKMHFLDAKRVIDLTWGNGSFWKWEHGLKVVGVDIATDAEIKGDGRRTGLASDSFDVAVIDPPFMHGRDGTYEGSSSHDGSSRHRYPRHLYSMAKTQEDILALYTGLMAEARRLAPSMIVKCKDIISNRRYYPVSCSVASIAHAQGWELIDKAVFVANTLPRDPRWKQQHLRRQESYFLVFRR